MPGIYALLIDEDTTIASGSDSEEYAVHITCSTMAPVSRTVELYRRDTTTGKTLVVDANGLADANMVKMGPTGSGTAQTARDIGASVLLSSGTGTGQLDFTSGVVKANATQWLGGTIPAVNVTGVPIVDTKYVTGTLQTARDLGASVLISSGTGTGQLDVTSGRIKADTVFWNAAAVSVPTNAGVPNVNVKTWNDLATVALPLVPTTAGRTLDVSTTGEAGIDWANIGSPTTTQNLSGTSTKALEPTTAGRTLDVTTTGEAGIDWNNIGAPTTTVNLSGTTIKTATDVETDTQDIQSRLPAALVGGRIDASVGAMAANVMTAAAAAPDLTTELQSGLATSSALATAQTSLDAIKSKTDNLPVDPADASDIAASFVTVNSKLDAIDDFVDTEVAAIKAKTDNLPSDPADASDIASSFSTVNSTLATIASYIDTEVSAIKAKTDNLPASPAATGDAMTLTSAYDFAKGTIAMTESYVLQGATMTPVQALYQTVQSLGENSVVGTTMTVKKRDGATTAKTFTLDNAVNPTSIMETT